MMRSATMLLILLCVPLRVAAQTLPSQSEVVSTMTLVNDYWIGQNPNPGNNQWARATYFSGNMAMYATYPDNNYLDYSLLWATNHGWGLNGGTFTRLADNHCAGQTYIALYEMDPIPDRIADITTCFQNLVDGTDINDWSWIDALYMAMPVFARLGVIHNDTEYFDQMYAFYDDCKSRRGLYDGSAGLWYRDQGYDPPASTPNGEPIFWSRGNGWVIAAHAKVLTHLPANDPHRAEYIATLQAMAAALMDVQRTDGFWNVSLADPLDHPGPETSGTAFFTYGIAWGINNGYLDAATYTPVVARAWNAMAQIAVHPDGKLGYVQGPASDPSEGQPVTYETTTDFGVGAFLLAGSEVYKLAGGDPPPPPPDPGTNLALDNLLSSSGEEAGNPATQAVDGSIATRWSSEFFPQWIELDLGAVCSIEVAEVNPFEGRAYQYTVEGKVNSGDAYSVFVDRSTNTSGGSAIVDSIPPVEARFVRLTVTGADVYTGTWVSILEFKLFGQVATGVGGEPPAALVLGQNYPNPFNPSTTIPFRIEQDSHVALRVYDIAGRLVRTLIDRTMNSGPHTEEWDGLDQNGLPVASGVYFYRLQAGEDVLTQKAILLK